MIIRMTAVAIKTMIMILGIVIAGETMMRINNGVSAIVNSTSNSKIRIARIMIMRMTIQQVPGTAIQ